MKVDVIGDTHGSFRQLAEWARTGSADVLIHVGDAGAGFGINDRFAQFAALLGHTGKRAYFVRGNHDDPAYYAEGRQVGENLVFLPDYATVRIDGGDILCVGGALSVDRTQRTEGVDYWRDEAFVWNPYRLAGLERPPRWVITHTAPLDWTGVPRRNAFMDSWFAADPALWDDTAQENRDLTALAKALHVNEHGKGTVERWFYGHFHRSRTVRLVGGTHATMLAENEIQPLNYES